MPIPDLSWKRSAACKGKPTQMFFPKRGTLFLREAKAVCDKCPVRAECLQSAFDNDDNHGVWGGLSPDEIRTYRNKGFTDANKVLAIELANRREADRKKRRAA